MAKAVPVVNESTYLSDNVASLVEVQVSAISEFNVYQYHTSRSGRWRNRFLRLSMINALRVNHRQCVTYEDVAEFVC